MARPSRAYIFATGWQACRNLTMSQLRHAAGSPSAPARHRLTAGNGRQTITEPNAYPDWAERRSAQAWAQALQRWNRGIAGAMTAPDPRAACREIGEGIARLFDADTWYVIFFHPGETPIMYDYFDSASRHDRYADGPYLLDPFYTSFQRGDPPGAYLKRDIAPEDLTEITAYLEYDQEIFGLMDEAGLVIDLENETRVLVCFARATERFERPPYMPGHLPLLHGLAPIVQIVMQAAWDHAMQDNPDGPSDRSRKHSRIEEIFRTFGSEHLTQRELEVSNLLIKGFSAREIGVLLDISYGTARNHIKKVYQKLKVSSQSELCGSFIEQLLDQDLL